MMNRQSFKHNLWMSIGRKDYLLPLIEIYSTFKTGGLSVLNKDTELLIDGFPRSANTYAVATFKLLNNNNYRIAHHVHGAGQFKKAAKYNIPAILLIREPLDAVSSLIIRYPKLDAQQVIMNYQNFYSPLVSLSEHYVVGDFNQIINNFSGIIGLVNKKFSCNFNSRELKKDDLMKIQLLIDEMDMRDIGSKTVDEMTVARPSEGRKKKSALQKQDLEKKFGDDLVKARELYTYFVNKSGL